MHTMKEFFLTFNIVVGILIVILILIQGGGAGIGSAWGGSGETFQTRRGIEKWTLKAVSILVFVFFVVSVVNLVL